jgi:hypothetical protein
VATGTYNPTKGLIEMDKEILPRKSGLLCLNEWHVKLGHVSEPLLKRTLDTYGMSYSGKLDDCESCLEGKMRKLPVSKKSDSTYSIVELIECDSKSFSSTSYDGFRSNVKFVDAASGFVYTAWVKDLKSITILEEFRMLKERLENLTQKKIK